MGIINITLEINQGDKSYKAKIKPDKYGRLSVYVFLKGDKLPLYGTSFGSNYNDVIKWIEYKCKTHSESIKQELV